MENPDIRTLGLRTGEAKRRLEQYGKNELVPPKKETLLHKALHIVCEPMFLLLIAAAVIYFILGEPRDGAIMLVFVVGIISIDIIQEWKTDRTLNALRELSAPRVTVVRDGILKEIASVDLVPGDVMFIHEGVKIPADGLVLRCSDLCVDESSLTGESEPVWKERSPAEQTADVWRKDYCYAGTLATQGNAYVEVEHTGASTEYGKIGADVAAAPDAPTPLQRETGALVRLCVGIAGVLFALVGLVTYFNLTDHAPGPRIIESVLAGITLTMAMIPEEFPVILTVFLSMGAWRLARKNSLVRRLPSVETLGAVSALCVDKTGTVTLNQMSVRSLWAADGDERALCEAMGLACETDAYDPMEKAMLAACEGRGLSRAELFAGDLVLEYPFTNELKMMGHVWSRDDGLIVAAKGSPERILPLCNLSAKQKAEAKAKLAEFSGQALRVIAVGTMRPASDADIPAAITDCHLMLCGLVGLADPPRESVRDDIAACVRAGIRVVMITGDNGATASSIAKQVGIPDADNVVTGDALDALTDEELCVRVQHTGVFARVVPAHKMRIVKALKQNGETVAMTGDGVNDAPALKHADIGIAMGKRGSEVSREAADLILMDDNFSTIVETVRDGRRIYDNIRKAIGYVFTIHIPIALSSLIAPMLGISPGNLLLLPLHVVLLELIIDPTCSIVLERQPAELDIMDRPPRDTKRGLLDAGVLLKSILQGLTVFAGSFGLYYAALRSGAGAEAARTMGMAAVMLANLFLVQVNSSDHDFVGKSLIRLIRDKVMWAVNLGTIAALLLLIYTPLSHLLKFAPLSTGQLFTTLGVAAASGAVV